MARARLTGSSERTSGSITATTATGGTAGSTRPKWAAGCAYFPQPQSSGTAMSRSSIDPFVSMIGSGNARVPSSPEHHHLLAHQGGSRSQQRHHHRGHAAPRRSDEQQSPSLDVEQSAAQAREVVRHRLRQDLGHQLLHQPHAVGCSSMRSGPS